MDDESAASLMGVIGVTSEVAAGLLQLTSGDVEQAIALYFDNPDVVNSLPVTGVSAAGTTGTASSGAAATAPPSFPQTFSSSTRAPSNPAGAPRGGVITIDSDSETDGDDVQMGGTPAPFRDDDAQAATVAARSAQEDEDAAYARQLQEELYGASGGGAGAAAGGAGGLGGGLGGGDDDVRAPIARTTETLVAPSAGMGGYHGLLGAADDEEEAQEAAQFLANMRRERRLRNEARSTRNPFSQSVWDPVSLGPALDDPEDDSNNSPQTSTSRRLAELFRPPVDLLTHLNWDDTRDEGKDQKKWILVNLQDMTDFRCQMLNRDVWADAGVKEVVREKFLFLQYDKDHSAAAHYINLYLPNQQHNIHNYPHVAVVDPRTGEQMKVWAGDNCPTTAASFRAELQDFLARYRFEGKNPVATVKAPQQQRVVDVDRMTEEEMLQMAMQNSLEAASGGAGAGGASGGSGVESGSESSSSRPRPGIHDPDQLTRQPAAAAADKGKRKATDEGDDADVPITEAPPAAPESAWARIAADRPHAEPAAGPGITRIQFMHPGGRVIRRFDTRDPVRRLYEWLKAEPLGEGREGVEFELKRMPQGVDLIADLDQTIEEAGIKQSTLAVEFIEN